MASSFSIRSTHLDNFPFVEAGRKLWHAHFNHSPFPVHKYTVEYVELTKLTNLRQDLDLLSWQSFAGQFKHPTWLAAGLVGWSKWWQARDLASFRTALIALLNRVKVAKMEVIRNRGRSTTNSVGTETTQNLWFQLKVSPFPFICGTNKQPAASGRLPHLVG